MSRINGKLAEGWIEENHPENGLFKVYWTDVKGPHDGSATFEPTEDGIRYEWYYKDGKMADGISKGWFPKNCNLPTHLKVKRTWKDGKRDGLSTEYYENGQKKWEGTWKDGLRDGLYTRWYENGQKMEQRTHKDGKRDGLGTWWYDNGQMKSEKTYKDGKIK